MRSTIPALSKPVDLGVRTMGPQARKVASARPSRRNALDGGLRLTTHQFALQENNPFVRSTTRSIFLIGVLGETATILLFATGAMPTDAAIVIGLFLAFGSIALPLNLRWMNRGHTELDAERLLIKSKAGTHAYRWQDISSVQVTSLRASIPIGSFFYHLTGISRDERVVELRLHRSPRLGVGIGRFGTDIVGVPVPGFKLAHVYVRDPERFARAAQPFLRR
jgi:hypothetical protein